LAGRLLDPNATIDADYQMPGEAGTKSDKSVVFCSESADLGLESDEK
jgi:hypothetical protein